MKTISTAIFFILISVSGWARFQDGFKSIHDIWISLDEKFLHLKSAQCENLIDTPTSELGAHNPVTGEVSNPTPQFGFLRWYESCLAGYSDTLRTRTANPDELKIKEKIFADLLRPVYGKVLETLNKNEVLYLQADLLRTSVFSEQDRKALVIHLIEWTLGSDEEILHQGRIHDMDQFKNDVFKWAENRDHNHIYSYAITVVMALLKRDEFLMY